MKEQIKNNLQAFSSGNFYKCSLDLFAALGYSSKRTYEVSDKAKFKTIFLQKNFNEEKLMFNNWKKACFLFVLHPENLNTDDNNPITAEHLGNRDIRAYHFYAIELADDIYTKTQLSNIAREINKQRPVPAFILFKYGGLLTLAIMDRRTSKRDSNADVLEKTVLIKDIRVGNPHRAHIDILADLSFEQIRSKFQVQNFVDLHLNWIKALSVSELNEKFYKELSNWFFWMLDNSTLAPENAPVQDSTMFAIRLTTRIIFNWFIKEKGLISDELFDKEKYLSLLKPEYKNNGKLYYKAILQNLFFGCLSMPQKERRFRQQGDYQGKNKDYNMNGYFRHEEYFADSNKFLRLVNNIPFVNGGLFECMDDKDNKKYIDCFTDDSKKDFLDIPDYVFFMEEEKTADISAHFDNKQEYKNAKVRGLFAILSSYKFTIDETTPIEEEIALDPELLGRVFENLLAAHNPETKTTARKATGSYYTPREIVDYMCEQSLLNYLKTKLEGFNIEDLDEKLAVLLSYSENCGFEKEEHKKAIISAVNQVKICDPACGSGAFPMGLLHKLTHILAKIDPDNAKWKEQQLKGITDPELEARIEAEFENNNLDYGRKLYLIQNCIFGVDIQPMATQISRLRFFISLIVDEKADSQKDNMGILPLPNLETKFVAANTLIGLGNNDENSLFTFQLKDEIKKLQNCRKLYFSAKTREQKLELKEKDKTIRQEIRKQAEEKGLSLKLLTPLLDWNPYDKDSSSPWFDPEWMFGVKKFDIVIGNPPYGFRTVLSKEEKKYFRQTLGIEFKSGDSAELFLKISFDRFLIKKGILTFIIPKKSFYGEAWEDTRIKYWKQSNFIYGIDTGKSFNKVLLEAIVFGVQKIPNNNSKIELGFLEDTGEINFFIADNFNSVLSEYKTLQIYSILNKSLYKKIKEKSIKEKAGGKLGLPIGTDFYSDYPQEFKLLKGIDIARYEIRNHRFLANKDKLKNWDNAQEFLKPKIICQRLVAHIKKPRPHLQLAATFDAEGILITNTITSFVLPKSVNEKFFIGYLNSSFAAWYFYNFIYCHAIRGMDLYDFYIRQLPIPQASPEQQDPIIALVDKILTAKKANPQADTSKLEHQIDLLVYKLYGLTYQEAKTIDPDLQITEDEYNK